MHKKGFVKLSDKNRIAEEKKYPGYVRSPNIRLFRKGLEFVGRVHERISPYAARHNLKIEDADIHIHHYEDEKDISKRQLKYLKILENNLCSLEEQNNSEDTKLAYFQAGSILLNFTLEYEKAISYFEKSLDFDRRAALEATAQCYVKLKEYGKPYNI